MKGRRCLPLSRIRHGCCCYFPAGLRRSLKSTIRWRDRVDTAVVDVADDVDFVVVDDTVVDVDDAASR